MANSAFKIEKVSIPVPPNKGGTGVTTITDKGVIIGAGTGNVTTIAPGTSGNILKSDGTNWTSGAGAVSDISVTYDSLATDLIGIVAMSTSNVDWSAGAIFTKTLTGNTTLTFSNYQLDKIIVLEITGNYSLSFPSTVDIIAGVYDGTVMNYITLHCTTSSGGAEEVWGSIVQRSTSSNNYGYFAGGILNGSTYTATADRIVFSTGVTSANTVSNLSQVRGNLAGLSDGATYGYFAGGYTNASTYVATADRIIFSTGATSANTVSNLSQARGNLAGLSDGATYGYFAGGDSGSFLATADRIIFSTGATSANTVSNLSQTRRYLAGLSDGATYGYFAGGSNGSYVATADRIVFSTGATSANTVSNLSQARGNLTGLSDDVTYGYFAGGYTNSAYVATADRIVFSTGATSANTVSNLSQARAYLAGLSDGATYGYFAGGGTSSNLVTADRIVFSTGATSASTVSNLSQAKGWLAGLSDCAV
jgi:hypothetical protein